MEPTQELVALLTEIRDMQRQHLDEYRDNVARATEREQERQSKLRAINMGILVSSSVVLVGLLAFFFIYIKPAML